MSNKARRLAIKMARNLCAVGVLSAALAWASVGGSIAGTVKDPAGRVLPNASVTIRESGTGLVYQTHTDSKGHYNFPVLPVGHYELHVQASGFSSYERTDVVLDTNAALTLDASLPVGGVAQTVSVVDNALHVETTSTQLGQVITGRQMTAVPLNGRSFTDLLSLQPGVAPQTSITSTTVQDVGATILNPSGTLNPGTISVNGQREFANYFSVNGSNTEEDVNAGTAIIPNLDAIAEFRIIASNFDAEYGEFSGGQISVITKSGTNALHGNAFDFLRNTDLDARNYFSPTRGAFRQNQFGGTIGGPVRRDKVFFFVDYQGTRQTQGVDTGTISVPSAAQRNGNFNDPVTGFNDLSGFVSGPYLANLLTQKLGYSVVAGELYSGVFPTGVIPQSAWSVPAQRMLQYIPAPNTANGFSTSSFNQVVRDDKGAVRMDANTRWGLLSGYYFIDDFNLDDPYPVAQSGASVPGFDAITTGRAQLAALGLTRTFNSTMINELHVSYMRDNTNLGQPVGGLGVSLQSQGFENADGTPSIVALDPKGEGVENLNFNGYSTGAAANQLIQVNNTYQVTDALSKVLGNHTMKFGGEFHADQVNAHPIAQFNGSFVFSGQETGIDFADFLVGVPSQYNQSQLNPFFARNKYVGLFAQDSWRVFPNLTLNYGLRWDRIAPWSEKYNQISTFVAGAQSVVFPGAPAGILYPGDRIGDQTIPNTLAPIGNNFAPRVGIAWSPQSEPGSFLGKILGPPGTTSVRASVGNFYTAIDALSIAVLAANAPYGTTYTSPLPPLFATPFITASTGQNNGQPFPYTFAPLNSSRRNPDANIDWSTYEPIEGIPGYDIHGRIPYTEEWMFSIERQGGPNTVFSATYIGTSSHRQRVLIEPNPGDPALCLSLSQTSQVQPGTPTCGPDGENGVYYPITGGVVNGTRGPLGPNFGSNALQSTIGSANYNALELSARHTSGRLEFAASYTFSKSMDQSSNPGEEVNPFNPALSYGISSFDVKHNLVISYEYQLPFDQFLHPNRLTSGWSLSGITRFSSGFPITMINNGDNSLIGTNPNGINNASIDEPDYNGGPLHLSGNPRKNGNNYFNTTAFSLNALGTPGTAKRRFFYGPGADNWDMAVGKRLALTESKSLLFRVEAFNVFNHTQFNGPTSVDGDIGSGTFGEVISAAAPRILQGALKFNF
jgi:Carboxypeptidase regulatory-like domain/TonB dependent receptor